VAGSVKVNGKKTHTHSGSDAIATTRFCGASLALARWSTSQAVRSCRAGKRNASYSSSRSALSRANSGRSKPVAWAPSAAWRNAAFRACWCSTDASKRCSNAGWASRHPSNHADRNSNRLIRDLTVSWSDQS